jgi:hypothetical protein
VEDGIAGLALLIRRSRLANFNKKSFLPSAKSSLFFLAYLSRLLTQEKTNPLLSERTF